MGIQKEHGSKETKNTELSIATTLEDIIPGYGRKKKVLKALAKQTVYATEANTQTPKKDLQMDLSSARQKRYLKNSILNTRHKFLRSQKSPIKSKTSESTLPL